MAISTYGVYLMYRKGDSGEFTKLVDIKSFPDLGGSPEQLDTTTLSDRVKTSILGIQELDILDFTANYTKETFAEIKKLEGEELHFSVFFGDGGNDGAFNFDGALSVYANGGGVNEVVDMTISIAASTEIVFDDGTAA